MTNNHSILRNNENFEVLPYNLCKNYIDQISTNEECNVYEIDSKIQWDDLVSYRRTSECKEFNTIMDKFEGILKKSFSPDFGIVKYLKIYMLILRVKLKFYTIESLYTITGKDFSKNYGGGLLDIYNNSPNLMLTSLYPEQENLRMFGSFKDTTANGNFKIKCWSRTNKKQPHEVALHCRDKFEFICDSSRVSSSKEFDSSLDNIVKTFHSFKGKRPNGMLNVRIVQINNDVLIDT